MSGQGRLRKADRTVDALVTTFSDKPGMAIAMVNKSAAKAQRVTLSFDAQGEVRMYSISGKDTESYNDIDHEEVRIEEADLGSYVPGMEVVLAPHSVSVVQIGV